MAKDLKLSSSAKATILTQNNGVPGCKFEGEPEDYTVEQLKRNVKRFQVLFWLCSRRNFRAWTHYKTAMF